MKELLFPQFDKSIKNKAKEEAMLSFDKFGVETRWVDITKNGITIKQFNKMVTRVYEKGYADGLERGRELKAIDKKGGAFLRMKRVSKNIETDPYKQTGKQI